VRYDVAIGAGNLFVTSFAAHRHLTYISQVYSHVVNQIIAHEYRDGYFLIRPVFSLD